MLLVKSLLENDKEPKEELDPAEVSVNLSSEC